MYNTLSGAFFGSDGSRHEVREAYRRKDAPLIIYRKDKRGKWRKYGAVQRGGKQVYRFIGFQTPGFVHEFGYWFRECMREALEKA